MQNGGKCCENNFIDNNVNPIKTVTSSSLWKALENIIKKEGYISYNVDKRMISTDGGNYLGILYEVDIKGKTVHGDKETSIFIKNIIPSANLSILSVTDVYCRELFTYTELFEIYNDLQKNADVPIEERFKAVRSFDSNPEAILLENMTKKGYTTGHRMEVMSLKLAELSVQQLAKFHGLSFVLQKRNPDYFDRKLKVLNTPFNINDDWNNFASNMCKMTMKGLNNDQKEKISKIIPTIMEKYKIYFKEITWGCVCHCDYRQNNILMKETDGEITEVIPVDYQLIHYGCPLNDFFYFIFSGTDQEFRKNHLTDLKNMYYDTLEQFLRYFDMDVSLIFPRTEFERYYKERLYYGLIVSVLFLPFYFVTGDNIPDLGKDDMTAVNFELDSRFNERIQGAVDDFVQWGYL